MNINFNFNPNKKNGYHLSIGGFTINRNPMAGVYEIIRQAIKDIHMYAHSNGRGVDELAGAMGIPFLPTRSSLGTDIVKIWGFPIEFRQKNSKLPDSKLIELENPFGTWCDTKKVVLVPAINPDVTIIHVQKAHFRGNCRIDGPNFEGIKTFKGKM